MPSSTKATRSRASRSRAEQNVEKILNATIRLVSEHGVNEVTTSRIAKLAGIPVGSVYRYFSNKEDIFKALAEENQRRLDSRFEEFLPANPESLSSDEYIDAWVENILETIRNDSTSLELMRLAVRLPDHHRTKQASTTRWIRSVRHLRVFSELEMDAEERSAFYRVWLAVGMDIMEQVLLTEDETKYQARKEQTKTLLRSYLRYYRDRAA